MDEVREKIADITADMNFERRTRVSEAQKQQMRRLLDNLSEAKKRVDKLHLRLWYAQNSGDYHSLSAEEAEREIEEIRKGLGDV